MQKASIGPRSYLCPMPAVIVGSLVEERPNYLVASYVGLVEEEPPMIGISLRKTHYSNVGIRRNGAFSVSIPCADLVQRVDHCGIVSGRTDDKSGCFTAFYGKLATAPMPAECPINMECRLVQVIDFLGSHELFVGEIVETYVDDSLYVDGAIDPSRLDPLVFSVLDSSYRRMGTLVGRAWAIGRHCDAPKS